MDDLNHDGRVDAGDSRLPYDAIESMLGEPPFAKFQGGMGWYPGIGAPAVRPCGRARRAGAVEIVGSRQSVVAKSDDILGTAHRCSQVFSSRWRWGPTRRSLSAAANGNST